MPCLQMHTLRSHVFGNCHMQCSAWPVASRADGGALSTGRMTTTTRRIHGGPQYPSLARPQHVCPSSTGNSTCGTSPFPFAIGRVTGPVPRTIRPMSHLWSRTGSWAGSRNRRRRSRNRRRRCRHERAPRSPFQQSDGAHYLCGCCRHRRSEVSQLSDHRVSCARVDVCPQAQ